MSYLYLDIETVPDDSRKELWGLPEPIERPPDADTFLRYNAIDIARYVKDNAISLPADWLDAVWDLERENPKARSTVLNALQAAKGAEAALTKELSLDPERCRVVAIGWAVEEHIPMAVGDTGKVNDEEMMLSRFWDLFAYATTLVGFNILGFDLPVICARSILLGVRPTVQIDWRKYGNPQVIDLMLYRFPYGKAKSLKLLAQQYGIDVPAPDVDGSMVHQMSADEIAEYVKSDIVVTRELHRRFAGFFCPPIYEDEELF